MPFFWQKRSRTKIPLGVSCHNVPLSVNSFACFPSADSMNLASTKRWHTVLAISLAIENVVVVVVVTILEGSFGSGMRLDWENFSDPRLLIASSERKEWSHLLRKRRCDSSGKLTMSVAKRSLKSWNRCK